MSVEANRTVPNRRVLYPGSFDPIHLGHVDVIEQSHALFGDVVVVVMYNHAKDSGMFGADDRVEMIATATSHLDGVTVEKHTGLAVQAAADAEVDFIVKGVRSAADFDIEQQMAQTNHSVTGIRTVYLPCRPDLGFVSSRFVREIANYGGDVAHLVPPVVSDALVRRVGARERTDCR